MKKFSVPTLVIISLVITCAFIEIVDAVSASPTSSPTTSPTQAPPGVSGFCADKCAYRCSRNPRNLCKKLCMHCCKKCQCVPNGPFADKSQCPCYRDLKNDEGQSKCP